MKMFLILSVASMLASCVQPNGPMIGPYQQQYTSSGRCVQVAQRPLIRSYGSYGQQQPVCSHGQQQRPLGYQIQGGFRPQGYSGYGQSYQQPQVQQWQPGTPYRGMPLYNGSYERGAAAAENMVNGIGRQYRRQY
jgi:hypothetical protein